MRIFLLTFFGLTALALASYLSLEPSITSAASSIGTTTVTLVVESEIAVTPDATITMAPNVTLSQDSSVGSGTFNVNTSDANGYTLSFKASTTPAMRNGVDSFADYGEGVEGTPESWSVGAAAYEFGFTAYGDDVNTGTWGAAGACGTAGADTLSSTMKWMGFNGTTPVAGVATKSTPTAPTGSNTEICVAAEQGDSVSAPSGTYNATIVGTASTQ
ncbi:MAG: hypothetical protein WCW77_03815 [Patescibacteria group bacterium]|jgi:hypothetical protein